ncbi:MAG: hypothetical protein ACRDZ8_01285, partial [Acidimicrobiales bacterium]
MRIVGGFALLALGLPVPENVDGGVDVGVGVVAADLMGCRSAAPLLCDGPGMMRAGAEERERTCDVGRCWECGVGRNVRGVRVTFSRRKGSESNQTRGFHTKTSRRKKVTVEPTQQYVGVDLHRRRS